MDRTKKFWNKEAKNYDKQVNEKYKETYQDTIRLTKKYLRSDQTVFDYACGTGIITIELSKYVHKMIAIDISDKMIELAKDKAEKKKLTNIDFIVADVFDPKFDGIKVDALLAFNILYFVEDLEQTLKRIQELLLPGGLFISATDCLGETKSFRDFLISLLSKIGVFPLIKRYTTKQLINYITKQEFKIIEKQNLFQNPPNYFIVAQKPGRE
jgi:ubiquinone/menaquinone biosynthesis C-methylase UbiE